MRVGTASTTSGTYHISAPSGGSAHILKMAVSLKDMHVVADPIGYGRGGGRRVTCTNRMKH